MAVPRNRVLLLTMALVSACGGGSGGNPPPANGGNPPPAPPTVDIDNLYVLAPPGLTVGVAVPAGDAGNSVLSSMPRQAIVNAHFNQVTAENIMKPSYLHPAENTFFFDDADALVNYAASQGKSVHGHTLVWHNQLPAWMISFAPGDAASWSAMMSTHITTIASRYAMANIVLSWDVVNEAFADSDADSDGLYDLRDTIWRSNIGDDYLETAYRAAAAADPDADLYYNDYNLAGVPAKLNAVLDMVDRFRNYPNPVPIHGIGFQMHVSLTWPDIGHIRDAFALAANEDLKVKISELDVTVNTDSNGNPLSMTQLAPAVAQQQQARFEAIVAAYLDAVPASLRGGISVWGIADIDSWRRSSTDFEWPLLFDDQMQPKPALQGFADGLSSTP